MSGAGAGAADELRVALAGAAAGVDPGRLARRLGARRLLQAGAGELARHGALPALVDALRIARGADADAYRRSLVERGIGVAAMSDAEYPARLRELPDPPLAVFWRGAKLEALGWPGPVVAVVGSRRGADAAVRLAEELAATAAARGALVVSGLALGVDAAAHRGALDGGGITLAVLGSGVDVTYPRTNRSLFGRVAAGGLLLSEYPPGTRPAPWRFPARNRLIAALADAVVVVEARERSGALITADFALELGRDVLAVPGWPGFAGSAGTNALLKAGAGLVEGPEDLASWLGLPAPAPRPVPTGRPGSVLEELRRAAADPDELAVRLGLGPSEVASALTRLELEQLIARDPSGRWVPR
ncbi:MAG: DNA-processing protein DprA [Gaiellales bacterium]